MSDVYDGELFRERNEHNATKRSLRDTREKLDEHIKEKAVDRALKQFDPAKADVHLLGEVIRGANLRVDANDRAIVDVDDLTMPVDEVPAYMQAKPEKFSNLTDAPKPPEPTKRELRAAKIKAMPMDQYMKNREIPGFLDGETE